MQIAGLIPVRLAATRLPRKPLLEIAGRPMVWHVWNRAVQAEGLTAVYVTTPDAEIAEAVEQFGGKTVLTSHDCRTGSDRLAEAARLLGLQQDDIVVNMQGDEPMLDPAAISAVIQPLLKESSVVMSSVHCPCPPESYEDPAAVKVVCAQNGDALYFSRSRIPHPRLEGHLLPRLHLGLYAYRAGFLQTFAALPPTPLELSESLEQLRALEHGYRIRMAEVEKPSIGVDTLSDLEKVRKLLS